MMNIGNLQRSPFILYLPFDRGRIYVLRAGWEATRKIQHQQVAILMHRLYDLYLLFLPIPKVYL